MQAALRADERLARSKSADAEARCAAPFERVALFTTFDEVASTWAELEETVPCSPYQRAAWARAWCATVGAARCWTPIIVVAYDGRNRPVALLPLVRGPRRLISRAEFMGGKDSNGNLALLAEPALWNESAVRRLLVDAGRMARVDLLVLRNQPEGWGGAANPLLSLPHQPSPSASHATPLLADPEQWVASRLSKHARKRLRQKEAKLEAIGLVAHRRASTDAELATLVSGYARMKTDRASTSGVPPPSPAQLRFYEQAGRQGTLPRSAVEFHGLWCGDELVAVLGGTGHGDRFSGMVLAMEPRADVAQCSPGELLVKHVVGDMCRRGFRQFDLGIGEARYKRTFCPEPEPLFDTIVPITLAGTIAAFAVAGRNGLKRRLKRSERVVATLRRAKAALYRRPDVNRP